MVALIDKTNRNTIGIDSVERAICWSALLLRNAYLQEESKSIKDSFQIAPQIKLIQGNLTPIITIIATIYFDNNSLLEGGNILDNIVEKSTNTVSYNGAILIPSDDNYLPIVDDILPINTLEKYFYWNCQLLLENNIANNYSKVQILPSFKGSNTENKINISVVLNYNFRHYLNTNNLIQSIGIIQNTINESIPISLVGNEEIFGNNFIVGNSLNQTNQNSSLVGDETLFGNQQLVGN
jgi:hypothetical protein